MSVAVRIAASAWLLALVLVEDVSLAAKAVLTWTAPTRYENGAALTDLAGYVVQYRIKGGAWQYRRVANPAATTLTIWRLVPGTWQFRMRAYNVVGVRSDWTGLVEATLR